MKLAKNTRYCTNIKKREDIYDNSKEEEKKEKRKNNYQNIFIISMVINETTAMPRRRLKTRIGVIIFFKRA